MTADIHAVLERLIKLDASTITLRSKAATQEWSKVIAAARAALAQPELQELKPLVAAELDGTNHIKQEDYD